LPKEDPQIEGTRTEYQIGDLVNVSCKAGPAKPAAKLMWYINDEIAPLHYLREMVVDWPLRIQPAEGFEGLKATELYLTFIASRHHFANEMIKLRCTAVISQVFSRHQEVVVKDENKVRQLQSVTPMDYSSSNEIRLKCAATLFKVINTQSQETTINGYSGLSE
ncbi:uncharacterized protein B4U79_12225, partial [Dinothrombium tinctorium]